MMAKTLPVERFYIRMERVRDEGAAREMWRQYVRAHGWSKVGEPEVENDGTPFVIGKVVKTDEPLELSPDMTSPLRVASK